MLWIPIVALSAVFYAFGGFLDNYIADTHFKRYNSAAMIFFALITSAILMVVFGVMVGWDELVMGANGGAGMWLCLLTGLLDVAGYVAYYKALKGEEATGAVIMGQLSPVFALILGVTIAGEVFDLPAIMAFVMILAAVGVVTFGARKRGMNKMTPKSAWLMVLSSLMWAGSNVVFRMGAKDEPNYILTLFFVQVGIFVSVALLMLVERDWQDSIRKYLKKKTLWKVVLNTFNKGLAEVANFIQRYAFTLTSVALVSAAKNVMTLIFTFAMGLILSKLVPKFGREKLGRRAIIAHLIAVAFATIGLILMPK
jgi:drug/metabolite transporter (DMT)-like permease